MIRRIVAIISMLVTATTQAQTAETPTGELGFAHGVSTKETVKQITTRWNSSARAGSVWALPIRDR